MSLKDLKAQERRKRVRSYIRQRLTEVEMAKRLGVDVQTISEDVVIIRQENAGRLLANRELIDKDIENISKALETLQEVDEECWSIYYGTTKVSKPSSVAGLHRTEDVPYDPQTRLQALDRIRQNVIDRAKLLKLLNPTQINVEKLVYVEKVIPVMIERVVNIVLNYIPKEQQIEVLEKLKAIDIEGISEEK